MRPSCICPATSKRRLSPSFRPKLSARLVSTLRALRSSGSQAPAATLLCAGSVLEWLRLNSRLAQRRARSSGNLSSASGSPLIATSRARIIGYQSKRVTPAARSAAWKGTLCSGWMLMTKRSGASGGVVLRQASIRSVRSSTSRISASSPTARAETCKTANAGRAESWRVASTSARGADGHDGTTRRSSSTAT